METKAMKTSKYDFEFGNDLKTFKLFNVKLYNKGVRDW